MKLLTYQEAADTLSLSVRRVSQLAQEGRLVNGKSMGRKKTVTQKSVDNYAEEHGIIAPEGDGTEATLLEQVFDKCSWERKFSHQFPAGDYLWVWREADARSAIKILPRLQEETQQVCRAIFLCHDSRGQALIVTEEDWDE